MEAVPDRPCVISSVSAMLCAYDGIRNCRVSKWCAGYRQMLQDSVRLIDAVWT